MCWAQAEQMHGAAHDASVILAAVEHCAMPCKAQKAVVQNAHSLLPARSPCRFSRMPSSSARNHTRTSSKRPAA